MSGGAQANWNVSKNENILEKSSFEFSSWVTPARRFGTAKVILTFFGLSQTRGGCTPPEIDKSSKYRMTATSDIDFSWLFWHMPSVFNKCHDAFRKFQLKSPSRNRRSNTTDEVKVVMVQFRPWLDF